MKLLHIDSSVLGASSASRQIAASIVAEWRAREPGLDVVYRDLEADPIPHLDAVTLSGGDAAQGAASEATLRQFLEADVVVIGAPMYNFGIPSTLKAWIDRIAVAGRTFRYTENGSEGLAGGKRVIVASTRGGEHAGRSTDFVEPYLAHVFAFLGIDGVEFVRAEGLAYSPAHRERAMHDALASVTLTSPLARAA